MRYTIHQKEADEMTSKEIVRALIHTTGTTQQRLAEMLGYQRQSNIANILMKGSGNSMKVENFYKFMTAMGAKIVVRDSEGKEYELTSDLTEDHVIELK